MISSIASRVSMGHRKCREISHLVPHTYLMVLLVGSLRRHFSSSYTVSRIRLTFFTKDNCQLCKNAKAVLTETMNSASDKDITLTTVNILDPMNAEAFDNYCYDVPVLHVESTTGNKVVKFMHYFDKTKILEEIRKK